jgi:peptidoglycan/xylan/chitin deacetylase (PgdA/CDA1 family)
VRATFFLVGSQARKRPDLVRAIASAGHELACHSETHRSLAEMDREEIIRELFGPIAAVQEATGRVPRFFRPPGGHLSTEGRRVAAEFGLTPVMWSANCGPYEGGPASGMEQYVASAAAGSVVLMHNCEATTLEALPGIVSRLRARGLMPCRLSDVLR